MTPEYPRSWFEKSAEIEGDSKIGAAIPPGKEFFQLECGTWVWPSPLPGGGAYYSHNLREIADKLDGLNNENRTTKTT